MTMSPTRRDGLKPIRCEQTYRTTESPDGLRCGQYATTTATITLDTRTVVRHLCQRHAATTGESTNEH